MCEDLIHGRKIHGAKKSAIKEDTELIRGVYLNGFTDDISECLKLRSSIYETEYGEIAGRDEKDRDAVHVLLYDSNDRPIAAVRLLFGMDGDFEFGYLCVVPDARNEGNADFVMHLIFDKAAVSGAKKLYTTEINHHKEYFDRYGFEEADGRLVLDLVRYYREHSCHHDS